MWSELAWNWLKSDRMAVPVTRLARARGASVREWARRPFPAVVGAEPAALETRNGRHRRGRDEEDRACPQSPARNP